MKKPKNNKKGESIVETVMAMLLIVMAVLSFYTMISFASRLAVKAGEADRAYYEIYTKTDDVTVELSYDSNTFVAYKNTNGTLEYYSLP